MNRRQLLGLAGGTAVSTVVVGAVAPPAQAFMPFLFRLLLGTAVRSELKQRKVGQKARTAVQRRVKRMRTHRRRRS
jgi:hypothetical protein